MDFKEINIPFTFEWILHNFGIGMHCRKECLHSPIFTTPFMNASWQILLEPSDDYLSVRIHRISDEEVKGEIDFSIMLSMIIEDKRVKHVAYCNKNRKKFEYWGSKKFISWHELQKMEDIILPESELIIECLIEYHIYCVDRMLSFYTTLCKLYDKEKILETKESSESSDDDHTAKTCDKIPVLHSWFENLYSKRFPSFEDLDAEVKKRDMGCNDLSNRWELNSILREIEEDTTCFTWHIKEFSLLKQNEKFFSPAFRCGPHDWKLLFYLTVDDKGTELAEIYICPMSLYSNSRKVIRCKISVINRHGRLPLSQESVHVYDNNGQWRFPPFITTENLKKFKKSYLAFDILHLYCTFSVFWCDGNYETEKSWTALDHYTRTFRSKCNVFAVILKFREDILNLLETGWASDMTLKVGEKEIPVHRSILSARSEQFRDHINYLGKEDESEKLVIEVGDCDEETVRDLLKYLYCGYFHKGTKTFESESAPHLFEVNEEVIQLQTCKPSVTSLKFFVFKNNNVFNSLRKSGTQKS